MVARRTREKERVRESQPHPNQPGPAHQQREHGDEQTDREVIAEADIGLGLGALYHGRSAAEP